MLPRPMFGRGIMVGHLTEKVYIIKRVPACHCLPEGEFVTQSIWPRLNSILLHYQGNRMFIAA